MSDAQYQVRALRPGLHHPAKAAAAAADRVVLLSPFCSEDRTLLSTLFPACGPSPRATTTHITSSFPLLKPSRVGLGPPKSPATPSAQLDLGSFRFAFNSNPSGSGHKDLNPLRLHPHSRTATHISTHPHGSGGNQIPHAPSHPAHRACRASARRSKL